MLLPFRLALTLALLYDELFPTAHSSSLSSSVIDIGIDERRMSEVPVHVTVVVGDCWHGQLMMLHVLLLSFHVHASSCSP